MISKRLNKLNGKSEWAIVNSHVSETLLNFYGRSAEALYKVYTNRTNNKPRRYVRTYPMEPPPDLEDLGL